MSVTRRNFIQSLAGVSLGVLALSPALGARQIQVYRIKPVAGRKYAKAVERHFANKIYPSAAAAKARLPFKGIAHRLERVALAVPVDVSKEQFFGGRKDLDFRVASDRAYMGQLGLEMRQVTSQVV